MARKKIQDHSPHQRALRTFRRAAEENPDDAEIHLAWGEFLLEAVDRDELTTERGGEQEATNMIEFAIIQLERALKLAPDRPSVGIAVGRAYYLLAGDSQFENALLLGRAFDVLSELARRFPSSEAILRWSSIVTAKRAVQLKDPELAARAAGQIAQALTSEVDSFDRFEMRATWHHVLVDWGEIIARRDPAFEAAYDAYVRDVRRMRIDFRFQPRDGEVILDCG